jgi:TatD DNase family protein
MTPIFDSHCHYNLPPIVTHLEAAIMRARANEVTGAVVVGTDLATSARALALKTAQPNFLRASLGLHPENACLVQSDLGATTASTKIISVAEAEQLIEKFTLLWQRSAAQADGLGEIGLDFFHLDKKAVDFSQLKERQLMLLRAQLRLGRNQRWPIILHVRDQTCDLRDPNNAYGLILKVLEQEKMLKQQLIFHCFSGTRDYLHAVLALPKAYISFAGNITFKNAVNLRELLKAVPPTRLLLETDAPFLSPEPKRGQNCEPWYITLTAQKMSELGVDLNQVYQNSLDIFG